MRNDQLDVCITEAEHFLRVAKELKKNMPDFLNGDMYPCVVNGAFACELFMKSIMIKDFGEDKYCRGHNLQQLYNSLPDDRRKSIEGHYAEVNDTNSTELKEFLSRSANAFQDWRYAFEKSVQIKITTLFKFADVLQWEYDKVENMSPEI